MVVNARSWAGGALLVGAEDDFLTRVGKWRWVQSWVPGEIAAAPMADGLIEPGVVAIWVGKGFDPGTLRIGSPEFLTRNVTCSDPAIRPTSR